MPRKIERLHIAKFKSSSPVCILVLKVSLVYLLFFWSLSFDCHRSSCLLFFIAVCPSLSVLWLYFNVLPGTIV